MSDNDRTLQARLERAYLKAGAPSQWYRESRLEARRLARTYDVSLATSAGIIAAMSPRQQWATNLRMAESMLATGDCGGLGLSRRNARRIFDGERPLDVMNGPKTREFYRAIMGDPDAVVIDVWMARAMMVHPESVSGHYERYAAVIRRAASRSGCSPATFQAAVWTFVRGRAA